MTIEYTLENDSPVNIIMATLDGKVVRNIFKKQQSGSQREEIDCSSFVQGTYLLYFCNAATNEVSSSGVLSNKGSYNAGELYVTLILDEDDNKSLEFKDKLGQVVLTRQINGSEKVDTYYIYDNFGNLLYVLPPLVHDRKTTLSESDEVMKQYAYIYKYDYRNRCIEKKLPGIEPIYYIYDKADRLIFSQDGEQRTRGEWMFSIPDLFGRVAVTGICKNYITEGSEINAVVRATLTDGDKVITSPTMGYLISGVTLTAGFSITSANYYDHYNFLGYNDIPNTTDTKYVAEAGCGTATANAKGMPTGSIIAQLNGEATNLYTVMYYDNRGRLIQTKSSNHMKGKEFEYLAYNFVGQPTQKKHIHTANGTTKTELYTYTYDHAGRLIDTKHKLDTGAETLIASNTYDELGRLKINNKAGNKLRIYYAYNIRSWINYIGDTGNELSNSRWYKHSHSGNIVSIETRDYDENEMNFKYEYDNLSRLKTAYHTGGQTNAYSEYFDYDKLGNILTTQRYGNVEIGKFGLVDNLHYTYNGNQVTNIHDTGVKVNLSTWPDFKDYSVDATQTKVEYTYNANGAMTKDLNKGITRIEYNSLNSTRTEF